jgi:hypothetical protein
MVNIDYDNYSKFVEHVVNTKDLSFFKSHSLYIYMLEHVTEEQGNQYLSNISNKTKISFDDIKLFCELNDKQGNPNKIKFGSLETSATNLRYIWQAHLILSYFKTFNKESYDIVEVGGGYGGLCFAIYYFADLYNLKIKSYTIIDLLYPSKLQKMYLENLPIQSNINFVNATTFGANINMQGLFLISNYCFSEISESYQKLYIKYLFPKVEHGFMAWNMIPLYNFGFNTKVEEEVPNTGRFNKFIYF